MVEITNAPNKMTPEQIDKLQKAFAGKYAGADNFHRLPLVLTEGLTHKEISLSAEDSQLLEARKFQVIDIARAFGVPPHMIGETTKASSFGTGCCGIGIWVNLRDGEVAVDKRNLLFVRFVLHDRRKVFVEQAAAGVALIVAVLNQQDFCVLAAEHVVADVTVALLSSENLP
jgi:hypothetical protein